MTEATIPGGWTVSNLQEIAVAIGGGTPSKSNETYWAGGTIPWISPKDMKVFMLNHSEDRITEEALGRISLIPAKSILAVVRSGILAHTLPVAVNAMPVTINQDMRAFVPERGIQYRFLAWQLVAKAQEILGACSKDGTTVASIEGGALARYPLWIAPSNEQTRIVEKLEELLSDLDAGLAELKAAQKKLTQYRQSLLKAAMEGALTAEWRVECARRGEATETGAQLLERILTERRARWQAKQLAKFKEQGKTPSKDWQEKYSEPMRANATNLPGLPEGWTWASVEQLAELVSGHTPKDANEMADVNGEVLWFKVGDMNQEGNEEFMSVGGTRFSKYKAEKLGMRIAPKGTIIFPKRGGAISTNKKRRLIFSSCYDLNTMGLVPIRFAEDWLWWWFSGVDIGRLSDGSNVPQINNSDIAPLPIPLPPIFEQVEIIRLLTEQFEQLKVLQTAMDGALKLNAAQRKNILKAAFSGQLVAQDPNDEPASMLLERIRKERTPREAKGKNRNGRKLKEAA